MILSNMEKIKALSDEQLLAQLAECGEQTGPITASTRGLFEKRLLRCLAPQSSGAPLAECEDIISDSSLSSIVTGQNGVRKKSDISPKSDNLPKAPEPRKVPSVFYGVQLPPNAIIEKEVVFVFIEKSEALNLMKKFPGSRFKPFLTRRNAERFSRGLPDLSVPPLPKPQPNNIGPDPTPCRAPPLEGSAYRSVKTPDLVKLRKLLETADILGAKCLIWSNPRYLINSGDTPTLLQEGFRYNALHIAALKNLPKAAELILEILENPNFMQLLYPGEPEESKASRINFLVDLYLNTPDKGLGETALHFACKYGHADVVNVLASHPKTDRNRRNKYGDSPADLICTRSKVAVSPGLKSRIRELLDDRYYIQLWRSEDNSCPPHVAEPWSPTVDGDIATSLSDQSSPIKTNIAMSPVSFVLSPLECPVSVKAVAGPMSASQAKNFRKNWLNPPSVSPQERKQLADIRRRDCDKGLERIGRSVAHTMDIPWLEYWDFFGTYVDLWSEDGLKKLEQYLKERHDSLFRQRETDDTLSLISAKLTQLRLTSPPNTKSYLRGKSLSSCFGGGDTLVLYMDRTIAPVDTGKNSGDGKTESKSTKTNEKITNENLLAGAKSEMKGQELSAKLVLSTNSDFWCNHDIPLIDDSDSESSIDSFHTAMDQIDSDTESLFTPPQGPSPVNEPEEVLYFIYGTEPSKVDLDVVRALEGLNVTETQFPHIYNWRKRVSSFDPEQTNRWETPRHIRAATQLRINAATPSRQLLPAGVTLYSPHGVLSPVGSYRSPNSSSTSSSTSDSDSSFNSIENPRINLLSSFLSEN